jgi:hypothetical protein
MESHENSEKSDRDSAESGRKSGDSLESEVEKDLAAVERDTQRLAHDVEKLEEDEAKLEEEEQHRRIRFFVDGEEYLTRHAETTPNMIIKDFAGLDPATHYLVKISRDGQKSYKDDGDKPIRIHEDERFQVISTGPTPVSDGRGVTGVEGFLLGLRQLGYEPEIVPGTTDHVRFRYKVESGKYAGKSVWLGLIVPGDFPMTPPSGPHVSPRIHPLNPGGAHPTGGIHVQHSQQFAARDKQEWQYWSRPFDNPIDQWGKTKKTVAVYMNYIWRLWDSQ